MLGDYQNWIIGLSIIVALLAACATLRLVLRAARKSGSWLHYWVSGGAVLLATLVWALHFIGMLAFDMPIALSYDVPLPVLSLVLAMLVCGFALYIHSTELAYANRLLREETEERKNAEARLRHLAQNDPLTGLPNRGLFTDRLAHAMVMARRRDQPLALMMIDLDNFKEINDTLGHSAGDKVLQGVGALLKSTLREVDTVSRLGGDEFTVILEDLAQPGDVARVAEKIREALAAPFLIDGREIFVTMSIGIALYPEAGSDVDQLLNAADVALYRVKEEGRNGHVMYSEDMRSDTTKRLDMENLLRRALDRHEFVLHYQPKIELASGRVSGVEALLRWDSAELGLVPPSEFIPLAERTGLIVPIGEWVLRRACAEAKTWQHRGYGNLPVAVNLSPRQFRQRDLIERVADILQESGLDPRFLELEITETMMMVHPDRAVALLNALHGLGVQLSIDDFGTGYSSLAYLQRFPVQKLKIDRSFVAGLGAPANGSAMIVSSVIALAKSLKLGVVAEGVENREQLTALAQMGCGEYQGYLFSRPLTADDFARLLARNSTAASERQAVAA